MFAYWSKHLTVISNNKSPKLIHWWIQHYFARNLFEYCEYHLALGHGVEYMIEIIFFRKNEFFVYSFDKLRFSVRDLHTV
jgi:hypothetical protein